MKKTLVVLLVAGVVSFAGVSLARAQSADPALVTVPFQFIVGGKVLPAGRYRITEQAENPSLLLITRLDGKPVGAFAATESEPNPLSTGGEVHVAFKKYDGQYFLWQVAMPFRDTREIGLSKASAERMLAKLNLMPAGHADVASK
jgi:hypothetical protein